MTYQRVAQLLGVSDRETVTVIRELLEAVR